MAFTRDHRNHMSAQFLQIVSLSPSLSPLFLHPSSAQICSIMATPLTLLSIFFLLTILLMIPSSSAQCNPKDRSALLQWKADYGNPPSLSSWTTDTECCNWSGIDCEGTGRVQFIYTDFSNLSGPISPAIVRLTHLTTILLDGNAFTGPIPSFLARLTGLTYLDLAQNRLSGPIPAFLGNLPLTLLTLNNNRLTGTIPSSLGLSSSLLYLRISHNRLTGSIPATFAGSGVNIVELDNNKLTGDASLLFGASRQVTELQLSRNGFKFNLSAVEFPGNLTVMDISHNLVYGGIPQQVTDLKHLRSFNVSYNELCGEIPIRGRIGRIGQFKGSAFIHNKCLCGSPLLACS